MNLTSGIDISIVKSNGDSDNSSMSMSAIKSLHTFNGKMNEMHQCYLGKAHRLMRQMELSQTREEIH